MNFSFEIAKTDPSDARRGRLTTPHGTVETPFFMPVGTQATVKGLTQEALEELGAEIILANTYHLYLRPGHELVRKLGGLHRFMSWPHAILTDSGGYQVFSLSDLRKMTDEGVRFRSHLDGSEHLLTPEKAAEIQLALGSDIAMVLDECIETPAPREKAEVAALLSRDRPRYLMGVGRPEQIADYVALGIDMMDCVLPTRAARHACLYTSEGRVLIKNARYAQDQRPIDPQCTCSVCRRYSRAYLRHLFAAGELIAAILATHHNVHFYLDIMRQIREAIEFGNLVNFSSDMHARYARGPA